MAPRLYRIQNPEAHFRVEKEQVIAAGFTIHGDASSERVAHASKMKESEKR
jgi:hypothetical protein